MQQSQAPLRIDAAGDTHIGRREHNEDTVLLRRDLNLFAVADGAGGEQAGATASALAATTIAHHFEETQSRSDDEFDELGLPAAARRLSSAVQRANREIVELARASDKYRDMGTTVVAAYVQPDRGALHVAHVGDSRMFRLRDGRLELLTRDHSLINDVLELVPDLDAARGAELPRHVVTRALGMTKTVRVTTSSFELFPGDRYLLCSDGLTDEIDDEQIAEALLQDNDPEARVRLLLDVANAAGAQDNVAALMFDVRLASGATDVPRPVKLRATPKKPAAPAQPDPDLSDPEIIIMGDDEDDDADDDAPEIHVAPADAAARREVDAVQQLVAPLPRSARPGASERDPTIRFQRSCPKCGAMYDGAKDACPNCWEP